MRYIRRAGQSLVLLLLTFRQAFADEPCVDPDTGAFVICGTPFEPAVPEIDGSGAIVAIGLVVGLVALLRERYFRG